MKFSRQQKSFTLIEMLIVIVIIGILAAALVPRLQSVQARARDTKRKADLKTIYNANEIFLLDKGKYPKPMNAAYPTGNYNNADDVVNSTQSQPRIAELTGIVTSLPVDPINQVDNITNFPWRTGNNTYSYHRVYIDGGPTYDLTTQLENLQDPDRCQVRQYKYGPNAANWCTASSAYRIRLYEYSPNSNSF